MVRRSSPQNSRPGRPRPRAVDSPKSGAASPNAGGIDEGNAARRLDSADESSETESATLTEAQLQSRAAEASAAEDRTWIERARYGDEAAFGSLVQKYQDRAIAIARNFVLNEETARDVAQEGFLRVYRNLDRYDPTHRFYTWFYRILVHLAIDRTRRRKRVQELLRQRALEPMGTPEDPSAPLESHDLRRQVSEVLAGLPDKYRVLLVLRDLEGFTSKEISEISGSNHATVRWRLHRARQIFREAWEGAGFEVTGGPVTSREDDPVDGD